MNRVNIFNQIHKALRALLYDTALMLQQTCFDDQLESKPALERLEMVLTQFDHHAAIEDEFILPALLKYEEATVQAFEQEHVEDHALAQQLRGLMSAIGQAVSAADKEEIGRNIVNRFVAFLSFNLVHMAKEEEVLNRLLWKYYSDEEIWGIHHRIVQSIPPAKAAAGAFWMVKGLNNEELAAWLQSVHKSGQDAVYRQLLDWSERELTYYRFDKLLAVLGETVPLPV